MANVKEIKVPDIGDFSDVDIIEVLVSPGDKIQAEDSLITLESDKATMEVPSSDSGIVKELKVKVGDKVSEGSVVLLLETSEEGATEAPAPSEPPATPPPETASTQTQPPAPASETPAVPHPQSVRNMEVDTAPVTQAVIDRDAHRLAHASPAVRHFARELGVDLSGVAGTGPKGRILREDVTAYVKSVMAGGAAPVGAGAAGGTGIPPIPPVDFAKFGEIERKPLTRIQKLSGPNLHRSWLNVPHVTQFDQADITEMEDFRKSLKADGEKRGVKLTPLAFLLKASAAALKQYPTFNASLAPEGDALILKKYCNIGVAVDTPEGLVVPVVKDVDKKNLFELAADLQTLSQKARDKKMSPTDMQGACFTISSLGGIGGTAFTPIVNAPEVAILGVSRSSIQPIWKDDQFVPRLILPLSLSYDHRVIDGALAARFTTYLSAVLSDIRRLLL